MCKKPVKMRITTTKCQKYGGVHFLLIFSLKHKDGVNAPREFLILNFKAGEKSDIIPVVRMRKNSLFVR